MAYFEAPIKKNGLFFEMSKIGSFQILRHMIPLGRGVYNVKKL